MIESEFQNVGQLAPGTTLAKMLGIVAQRIRVAGPGLQDGVQIHRGLLAITQPVAVQRRQFALQPEAKLGIRRLLQLPLA